MSGSNILLAPTGSIAAHKACEAVSSQVQNGHRVRPVAPAAVLRFAGAATPGGGPVVWCVQRLAPTCLLSQTSKQSLHAPLS